MIRLLIVDDEAVIRQGLRQAVNWAQHGIAIVGEARSGTEAMQKVRELRPDIVISDIRMSEGDGFSLARRLPQIQPGARMIMLSGYSDIEYMMEAIKGGVRDYLLKPAGSQQILESVLKLRDEILAERSKERQSNRIEILINENMDTLKALFLEELLLGQMDVDQARERAQTLGIELCGPNYALLCVTPGTGRDFELLQLVSSQLDPHRPVLHRQHNEIVAILNVRGDAHVCQLARLMEQMGDLIHRMTLPCTGTCDSLLALPALRQACREKMARSLWYPAERYLTAQLSDVFEPLPQRPLMEIERGIVQGVRLGGGAQTLEQIDALFALLHRVRPARAQCQDVLLGIARSIQVFSEDSGLYAQLEALFHGTYSMDEVQQIMRESVTGGYAQYGPQAKTALTYISQHYADELTLSELAQVLYISPSYLTRLLKNKTGRGFNEWLHIIRITKAKELLAESNLHHYQIAEQVGYKSYKIFSEYFSKIVGCSARNYRESVSAGRA